jgi:hypothetical protein
VHPLKLSPQVTGQAVDDLAAPSMPVLPLKYIVPNPPIEADQLNIYRHRRAQAGLADLPFERGEPIAVARGHIYHLSGHAQLTTKNNAICLPPRMDVQPGVLVTVMQKVPLSKLLKYHDKSGKKPVTH